MKMIECSHLNMIMAIKPTATQIDDYPVDRTLYRQLVSSLQFLTFTRLGIVHEVNKACQ